ncbi:MAG: Ig-like domain-containing protein [Mogibacterium sp.]|nr:Ig-like domain-containing protein [Mogibacterium sp.]
MKHNETIKRILAIMCLTLIVIAQVPFVVPLWGENEVIAADSFEVRVQYEGWREDKTPVKASFSSNELLSLGSNIYFYSNVTDVATVMRTVACGPTINAILDAAGIDRSSVSYIALKTTDGSGKDGRFPLKITPSMYSSTRYYYPKLPTRHNKDEDGERIMPREGALADAETVPAILGIKYYSTKNENKSVSADMMEAQTKYRFCIGQTELSEGEWSRPGYSGDVTSQESIQNVIGMFVVLKGSPISGIGISFEDEQFLVGSRHTAKVTTSGDALFIKDSNFSAEEMTWESSDDSIAEVSSSGVVTIVGAGKVTITANAPDGSSKSVTINAYMNEGDIQDTDDPDKTDKKIKTVVKKSKSTERIGEKHVVREISIGERIDLSEDNYETFAGDEEISALGEAEDYSRGALAGTIATTAAAATGGFVLRIRKYHIDK